MNGCSSIRVGGTTGGGRERTLSAVGRRGLHVPFHRTGRGDIGAGVWRHRGGVRRATIMGLGRWGRGVVASGALGPSKGIEYATLGRWTSRSLTGMGAALTRYADLTLGARITLV